MEISNDIQMPIFMQVSEKLTDAIFTGAFAEETQIPSTTEISMTYKINPATVLKGMNLLVDQGLIYKRRGVGMFVKQGARERIKTMRNEDFSEKFIKPLLDEAKKLDLSAEDLHKLIDKEMSDEARA
ncbi:MAG: GntR family transcriptional regulator [Sphaerochaetaceae bacterium]|jgi:GntR family transcriptional regulator|nr:GntR family transcriptional regulator [Sphaerochaetaceae bacterium]